MNYFRSFRHRNDGVSSIEFGLTIMIFLVAVGAFLELARIAFVSAYLDMTIAQTSKDIKNQSIAKSDYLTAFENALNEQSVIWDIINNDALTDIDVRYTNSIDGLLRGNFVANPEKLRENIGSKQAIALYTFKYEYKPMFFWYPKDLTKTFFSRQIVMVQEYEK